MAEDLYTIRKRYREQSRLRKSVRDANDERRVCQGF